MKRTVLLTVVLGILAIMLGGCPLFMDSAHTRAHKRVLNGELVEIHQFMDRYFWDYSWDDPYSN